jgi:hypothetical protein
MANSTTDVYLTGSAHTGAVKEPCVWNVTNGIILLDLDISENRDICEICRRYAFLVRSKRLNELCEKYCLLWWDADLPNTKYKIFGEFARYKCTCGKLVCGAHRWSRNGVKYCKDCAETIPTVIRKP